MHERDKQRQAARMFEARAYRAGLNPDSAAHAGTERALPLVLALERLKAAGEDTFPQAQEAALAEVYNYETIDLEEAFRVRDLIRIAMPNENAQPSRNSETGLQEFYDVCLPGDSYQQCAIDEIVAYGNRGGGGDVDWGGSGWTPPAPTPEPVFYGPPAPEAEPIEEIVVNGTDSQDPDFRFDRDFPPSIWTDPYPTPPEYAPDQDYHLEQDSKCGAARSELDRLTRLVNSDETTIQWLEELLKDPNVVHGNVATEIVNAKARLKVNRPLLDEKLAQINNDLPGCLPRA